MATSKPITTLIILLNLAMFTFVSTNAACPDLSACLSIANSLVNVQAGSQATSSCCQLIQGLATADASLCVCNSLHTTLLGSLLASVLDLTQGLPLIGGILPGLGNLPLIGGLLPALGNLPLIGGLLPTLGNLPLIGGLLPTLGNLPLIGGLLPTLGNLPLIGSLPSNVLDQEIIALVNACGLDSTKFKCSS